MDPNIQQAPTQTISSSNTPLAPMPEPSKSHSWIKWVLIIIIVAILSSGATYFILNSKSQNQTALPSTQTSPTPSADPTINWKTYTNSNYKFTIKYPTDFDAIDTTTPPFKIEKGNIYTITEFNKFKNGVMNDPIINIRIEKTFMPIKEWVNNRCSVGCAIKDGLILESIYSEETTVPYGETVFRKGDMLFIVSWSTTSKKDKETINIYKDIYNQILSTFKFTNQESLRINEQDIDICKVDNECIIVKFSSCCGQTKRAINKKYLELYSQHPEWQKFDNPKTCAVIGICPSDSNVNKATCNQSDNSTKRCEMKF